MLYPNENVLGHLEPAGYEDAGIIRCVWFPVMALFAKRLTFMPAEARESVMLPVFTRFGKYAAFMNKVLSKFKGLP